MRQQMLMKQKPNIFRYVSCNNPQAVYNLLVKAGYENVPKDKEVIAQLLAEYVLAKGDDGLKQLLLIHPDREALLATLPATMTGEPGNGGFLNCLGKPQNGSGCPFSSADATEDKKGISEKTINYLIIGGSAVLTATLLTLIIVNIVKK